MPIPLKLTTPEEPLKVSPEDLFHRLSRSALNLDALLQEFRCTHQDLQATLNDPKTAEFLALKTQLAALQLKLLAIEYLPHAFAKLVTLMNTSDKPEVCRRASSTIMNLAGIATKTAPAKPEPPPVTPPPGENAAQPLPEVPELEGTATAELLEAISHVLAFNREGINLSTIPLDQFDALKAAIRPFLPKDDPRNIPNDP
jgi:hypothetical protein